MSNETCRCPVCKSQRKTLYLIDTALIFAFVASLAAFCYTAALLCARVWQ